MAVLRIQEGHVARKTGATGTSNPRLNLTEQEMNKRLSAAIVVAAERVQGLDVEVIGADQKPGGNPDIFVALHMDGSDRASSRGGSLGHNGTANSKKFASLFKSLYQGLGLPSAMRSDNYTTALSNYYGYKASYAGWGRGPKILLENGFLTNDTDARWAQNNRKAVANAIVDSAAIYLGLKIKDGTAPASAPEADENPEVNVNEWYRIVQGATGQVPSLAVSLWQKRLNAWGALPKLVEDGLVGPATEAAHLQWTKDYGLSELTRPGKKQWRKLIGQVVDPPAPPREEDAASKAWRELERAQQTIKHREEAIRQAQMTNSQMVQKLKEIVDEHTI